MLVNLHKVDAQKWIESPENIYIGRKTKFLIASKWENQHRISGTNTRERVVKKFEEGIRGNQELLKDIHQLAGKNLGCCSAVLNSATATYCNNS